MAICQTCSKQLDRGYKKYCNKVCNPALCNACGGILRSNRTCSQECVDCHKHASQLYFDRCVDCRLAQKKQRTLNNAMKNTPPSTASQSIFGLEREIIALQKKNAMLEDRMADLEAQLALIVESVSDICTQNLLKMEGELDG